MTDRSQTRREQAALRRIAKLVADGVQPSDLFGVVAEEVACVIDVPFASIARYEPDDTVTACASVSPQGAMVDVGRRWPLEDTHAVRLVRERAAPARLDDYKEMQSELADAARRSGIRSTVAVPIVVAGRLWGAITASGADRLPEDTEARLVDFTALLAAAIANAESHAALARIAEEQAALRRIATLVAQEVALPELCSAIANELRGLIGTSEIRMLRVDGDESVVVVGSSGSGDAFRVGSRHPLARDGPVGRVLRTGRPTRIDDFGTVVGPMAEMARAIGIRAAIVAPIVVNGLWGAIAAGTTTDDPLPPDTGSRLAEFTDLMATAIANAESRGEVHRLADEQAALRRVATLVAQDAAPEAIFAMVSVEVDRLFGLDVDSADVAGVVRFDPGPALLVVGVSRTIEAVPLGSRWPPTGPYAPARVLHTGASARIDEGDLTSIGGPEAELLLSEGYFTQVASPIVVEGRLWGAISVNSRNELPQDTEERLERFTELVATAIANAESREALARLADEQAALRRVATLVAQGTSPHDLFEAVAEEVGRLLPAGSATMGRFDSDGGVTTLASWSTVADAFATSRQWPTEGTNIAWIVRQTGKSARRDDFSAATDPIGVAARDAGHKSAVGSPIVVEGHLWGLVTATSTEGPMPPDTEARLASFTELIATAIANAESREALDRLASEQAALRRVATLVAEGALPDALFRAVADEVESVVGLPTVTLSHHHADGSFTVVAAKDNPAFPVGSRWPLDGPSLAATIHETGRSARIDDYSNLGGAVAAAMHDASLRAAAGSPIVVDGKVWGHVSVAAKGAEPLPAGTEQRLLDFTELLATAIANADFRDALAQLADEQAALRRVATLVARDAPPEDVFNAVAMEVGTLLDTDITVVGRYDGDGTATATGSWSSAPGGVPVGTRSLVGGHNVLTLVAETARPARVDGYDNASGEAADIARRHGWSSSIAAPIIVEGRLWGVMLVATQRPEPFPAGAEERLATFTDLVATALANAQAHDEVQRFGEEQAALGRVATLVAAGAAPEQVFKSVVDEASSLLGLDLIEFVRYDGDDTGTVIAASGEHPFPPGSRWSLDDPSVMATVARTKRPARIDDYGDLEGEIARQARNAGFRSAIGAPLTVESRLWGVIIAISTDSEPIPERSLPRLGQFTELVATAVANAEARQALERVAAEQATLRRIATLVARGVQAEELFKVVAEETATALDAIAGVMRFEHDPPGGVLVGLSKETGIPVGTRWAFTEGMASAEVYRTGRSARITRNADHWSLLDGPVAEAGRRLGIMSQVSCPIVVEGSVWGVITVNAREELPPDTERRLENFADLVTTAIANAEARSELAASRRRIVTATDEARRRIERDLHDGIQQRLIALTFAARAMSRKPPEQLPALAAELAEGLGAVAEELREVARGIHPTILSEAGLGPALRALARRSGVPIDADVTIESRLPVPVEVAAYYVASEALANVAKHAKATVVELVARQEDRVLTLEVRDDGVGGADAEHGSGIAGLEDRVEALGGTISIASPAGVGTTLSLRLPVTP